MIQSARDFSMADTFDSRDVIETIAEMERLKEEHSEDGHDGGTEDPMCPLCDDEASEGMIALKDFEDEASGYISDWQYGEQFIAEQFFEQYAEQFADDIGAINDGSRFSNGSTPWPLMHIDWRAAADDLKQDYTSFDLLGQTFWAR